MIHPLEKRLLYASLEDLLTGLINTARADPPAAMARIQMDLNQGLPAGTISSSPKPQLRRDPRLDTAAQLYTAEILRQGILSHELNGTPTTRANAQGYLAVTILENAGVTLSGFVHSDPASVLKRQHDAYLAHAGHRYQEFHPGVTNLGLDAAVGSFQDHPALVSVIVFASPATRPPPRLFYRFGASNPSTELERIDGYVSGNLADHREQ